MKRSCVLVAAVVLLAVPAAAGEIYRWVDEQGRAHFGDRPAQGPAPTKVEVEKKGRVQVQPGVAPRELTRKPIWMDCTEFMGRPEFQKLTQMQRYHYQNECARAHRDRLDQRLRQERQAEARARRERKWAAED